jgi:hypothetical protein
VYGLTPAPDPESFDHKELQRYGLGARPDRPLERFLQIFGVDYDRQIVRDNCDASMNGDMHFALTSMMTPAGAHGINYDCVPVDVADDNFAKSGAAARRRTGMYDSATNPCGDIKQGTAAVHGTFGGAVAEARDVQLNTGSGNVGSKKALKPWLARINRQEGVNIDAERTTDENDSNDGGGVRGERKRSAYAAPAARSKRKGRNALNKRRVPRGQQRSL